MTTPAGIDLEAVAQLCVSVDGLTSQMRAEYDRQVRRYEGIRYLPNAITAYSAVAAGNTYTIAPAADMQAKKGWTWAVQRVGVSGLGTGTGTGTPPDQVIPWIGSSPTDVGMGQNQRNLITTPAPSWHPGRTGLVLQFPERLLFTAAIQTGSLATALYITADVIMVADEFLPDFLI